MFNAKASSAHELCLSRLAGPWIFPHSGMIPGDTIASAVHAELLRKFAKHHPSAPATARIATLEYELLAGYVTFLHAAGYSDDAHNDDSARAAAIAPPITESESPRARATLIALEELAVLRTRIEDAQNADAALALRVFAFFSLGHDADAVTEAHASGILRSDAGPVAAAAKGTGPAAVAAQLHAAHLTMAAAVAGLAAERSGATDVALDAYERAATVYLSVGRAPSGIDELERWVEVALYRSALLRTRLGRDAPAALKRYQAAESAWPASFRAPQRRAISAAYLGTLNGAFAGAAVPTLTGGPLAVGGTPVRTSTARRGRPDVAPRRGNTELPQAKAAVSRSLELSDSFPRAGETNSAAERLADELVLAWRHDGAAGEDAADEVVYILYRLARVTFRSQRVLRYLVEALAAAEAHVEAAKVLAQYAALVERAWGTSGMPDDAGLADGKPVDSPAEYVDTLLRGVHIQLTYLHDTDEATALTDKLLRLVGRTKSDGPVVSAPRPILAQILRAAARAATARGLAAPMPVRRTELLTAYELLHEAAALDPDAAEAHYTLACVQAQLRDTRGALVSGRRALELEPAALDTWHLLVLILSADRDYAGALALAEEALAQADADDEADAQSGSARTFLASYDFPPSPRERAEAYIQLLITHNTLTELTEGTAAALDEQRDVFDAFQRRLVTRAPEGARVSTQAGLAPMPAAARIASRFARETRLLVTLWLMSAATFRRAGDLEQARCAISEAERLDAAHPGVWVQLALWAQATQLQPAAVTCLYKALSCDAYNVPASVLLAQLFLDVDAPLPHSHQGALAAVADADSGTLLADPLLSPEAAARRAGARALGTAAQNRLGDVAAPFMWDADPNPASAGLAEVLLRTATQQHGWDAPEAWHLLARIERMRGNNSAERTALIEALMLEESRPIRVIRDVIAFP